MSDQENRELASDDLAEAMMNTIINKGPVDLLVNLGEAAFDFSTNTPFVKDIPILGSLVGILKMGVGVRDYIFTKKIYKFLLELHNISDEERNLQIRRTIRKRGKKLENKFSSI